MFAVEVGVSPYTGQGGVDLLSVDLDADGLVDIIRADPDGSWWHRNAL